MLKKISLHHSTRLLAQLPQPNAPPLRDALLRPNVPVTETEITGVTKVA